MQKRINHGEYCYHVKQFILALLLLCAILSIVNFCHVLSMFPFLFFGCTWKEVLPIQAIHLCFVKDRSSVSKTYKLQQLKMKSNTPWVIRYTLHLKILTLFFEVFFDKQFFLSWRQIIWKKLKVEFILRQSYRLRACNFTIKALF